METSGSAELTKIVPQSGAVIHQPFRSVSFDLSCKLPQGELARLYRMIETALPDISPRIIQFASPYEGEGASIIAFEMAVVVARVIGKRVLFIDTAAAQMERTRLSDTVGISIDALLLSGKSPHEAVAQVAGTELYIARLREREHNDAAPISITAIENALHNMANHFDLIVMDSQNLMNDAFSVALAKLVNGSIIVAEAERTRAPILTESKRRIEACGGRLIGAVVNKRRFYIPPFLYRLLYSSAEK